MSYPYLLKWILSNLLVLHLLVVSSEILNVLVNQIFFSFFRFPKSCPTKFNFLFENLKIYMLFPSILICVLNERNWEIFVEVAAGEARFLFQREKISGQKLGKF